MITDPGLTAFINGIDKGNTPFLEEILHEALKENVPVIRREMQSFLRTLLLLRKPLTVLEIGTATGFSALLMAEYSPEECRITTIENYEKRIPKALENFKRSGRAAQIDFIQVDAGDVLETLEGKFDLIFLDAAQGQYIRYLNDLKRLMGPGSVLLADNVLKGGDVCKPRFLTERRDRTIHKRMRDFLFALKGDDDLETSILPLGDGAAFCVMKDRPCGGDSCSAPGN